MNTNQTSRDDRGRIIRYGPYPELTLTSVLVGYGIGVLIAVSIGYAALILGFSIEGSELAAILGFGILRGLLGRSSIVENNINQTIASAVNGASSGLMFTVPALFILGQTDFHAVWMVFACIAGGILGIAFIIPLRKQMIDFERLTYPGGVAVATILKSPGAGIRRARLLLVGIAVSGLVHFFSQVLGFELWNLGEQIGMPDYMNGIWYVSLMTIGVGFIAGKGGVSFIVGGFVCYWILAPVLASFNLLPSPEELAATMQLEEHLQRTTMTAYLQKDVFRPVGIGMLIGGAIMGILLAFPLIANAVRSMQNAARTKATHAQDEMPIKLLYIGIVGATILLFFTAMASVREMGWIRGGIMAVLGTLWIWIAGVVLSECIGRTNWSPLSGMTLIAVTILVIIARDLGNTPAILSSIVVGAAACVAMSQATDMMMDLKTGYLVGASPRKQQMGQFLATWLGPIVVMGLIFVLHKAYTLGSEKLPAPQAGVLAGMIRGMLDGAAPVQKYAAGAGLGALLSASGIGGLGILVGLGFYLPFHTVLTYSIGTALRVFTDWRKGIRFSEEIGIPIAAGCIVGEALVGVGFALYHIIKGMVP
ncbi:MAG: OPT/YSL family transporter [Sedimentisphaerales bacterium]|nr:OPT/YSL family transporter [Sedimentisphaerales bacterium]